MWELDIISVNIKVNLNVKEKENIHYKNTFYIDCKIIELNEGRTDYFVMITLFIFTS